jgi:ABC-type uncharacterized transport system permease subunit
MKIRLKDIDLAKEWLNFHDTIATYRLYYVNLVTVNVVVTDIKKQHENNYYNFSESLKTDTILRRFILRLNNILLQCLYCVPF